MLILNAWNWWPGLWPGETIQRYVLVPELENEYATEQLFQFLIKSAQAKASALAWVNLQPLQG